MCEKCNGKGIIIIRSEDDYSRFNTTEEYLLYHSFLAAVGDYNDHKYKSIYCDCECCKEVIRNYNKFLHKDVKVLRQENVINGERC